MTDTHSSHVRRARIARVAVAAGLVLLATSGCSITPVSAYQREYLAKAVMVRDASVHHQQMEWHSYASKEAASGGYGVAGGGCGCN